LKKGFNPTNYGNTCIFEASLFKNAGGVIHGFTTRTGGVSAKPYDSLNLAFHVGDSPEAVIENRKRVCHILGAEIDNMVTAKQVHGTNVAVIEEGHFGLGAYSYDTSVPDTDGLVTDRPGLLLATFYADCVPVFIYDPVKKVAATVHAGWKGTLARIGAAALNKMAAVFGCDPSDCLVGIGPSIGPCCYEVDAAVIGLFRREFPGLDILNNTGEDKARLNLWEANRNIMAEAGIRPDNVELAEICTCCHQNLFFSYRGGQGQTGRMGAFIMLTEVPA